MRALRMYQGPSVSGQSHTHLGLEVDAHGAGKSNEPARESLLGICAAVGEGGSGLYDGRDAGPRCRSASETDPGGDTRCSASHSCARAASTHQAHEVAAAVQDVSPHLAALVPAAVRRIGPEDEQQRQRHARVLQWPPRWREGVVSYLLLSVCCSGAALKKISQGVMHCP